MCLHFEHLYLTLRLSVNLKMVRLLAVTQQKTEMQLALEMAFLLHLVREVAVEGEELQEPLVAVVVEELHFQKVLH